MAMVYENYRYRAALHIGDRSTVNTAVTEAVGGDSSRKSVLQEIT
jgi:hypothetical protein